ncbi:MAG: Omp28 family outer membrane lipoprotein [Saprospiraceae bacterium]|nr:Omp28 family outer membrane lipoprotein [Saprospiraceae bacterium]
MKNVFLFLSPAVLLFFSACKEQPVIIPDPSLNVTGRTVLVEEVTGVRCANCPTGTQTLVSLQQQYGKDKLVVVSIHAATGFSVPYAGGQDFRSAETLELVNYIGAPEGFPTAAVDRRLLLNEQLIFLTPHTRWGGEVAQDLQQDPSLAIALENTFDPSSRALNINVGILPDQMLSGEHRLTVLITQDSIVDPQLNGSTLIQNYIHRHVVRDVVSAPSGDPIAEPLEAGVLVNKTFNITLPQAWEAKHCSVVAYVHRAGADKEVIQAAEQHVIE